MRKLMPAFFEQLVQEKEPAVRVVLGHFMFVYIHPTSMETAASAAFS